MIRESGARACTIVLSLVLLQSAGAISSASAQHRPQQSKRALRADRARTQYALRPPAQTTLGTFYPTPYVMVRGNFPVGGGYSPLDISGDQTMALYGPFSPLRPATAPVLTYTRGYDGVTRVTEGVATSYPNLPVLSPVIYPTEANYFYGPRVIRTPPWWNSAINWIDQN
jgi:hypothetical protein